jgi:tetratricopeptide (TPR) repeat protein
MKEIYSSEDLQAAAAYLREGNLTDAIERLERVLPDGPEGALATQWLAGIYLWNGQYATARAAISQRTTGPLTDALRTKMVQAYMLEDMPGKAHEILPSQDQSKKDPERCLTLACYNASVGNYYYALGWLLHISHDEIGPERWLLDPYLQKLWQHFATNDPPAELLRALALLDEAAGFATLPAKIDRSMEFGIFSRRDLSPKYCPIFELDIPRGVARINPGSCLRHPALFAEFMAWSSSRIEDNLSLISKVVGGARGRSRELEFAKRYAAAGRYDKARSAVLLATEKNPGAIEEALAVPSLLPIAGAIRDLRQCRDTRPGALDELMAVEKLYNAGEPERALAIIDDLRSTIGEVTLLTLKGAIAHYYARNYEQALELANTVVDRWPDDPVAWFVAADSLRYMARLDDAADMMASAPPNIISLAKAKELADALKSFGHELPLFESQDCLQPLTDEQAAGAPDAFYAVGQLVGPGSFEPEKYFLGSFPSQAVAVHKCRQFLRQILHGMHVDGMDRDELILWAERLSLGACTIPASPFCPRADIREAAAQIAGESLSSQANQTTP